MPEEKFYLPIGFKLSDSDVTDATIAETGGEAEKIYTDQPTRTKLHSWFGKVLAISIGNLGGVEIASEYEKQKDKEVIPDTVLKIPFVDVGSLLVQVQRECWEKEIKDQKITCVNCGEKLTADIDLAKIEVPYRDEKPVEETMLVKFDKTYTIGEQVEQLREYEGLRYNAIRFRIPTLEDAIRHQGVSKDEVIFWRNVAFDTMRDLVFIDTEGNEEMLPKGWVTKRGKQLFTKDFSSRTLKSIRKSLQVDLPSVKYFYEEDCPVCSQPTPFFASSGNFFAV